MCNCGQKRRQAVTRNVAPARSPSRSPTRSPVRNTPPSSPSRQAQAVTRRLSGGNANGVVSIRR